jgi:hypothetical protein
LRGHSLISFLHPWVFSNRNPSITIVFLIYVLWQQT